MNELNRNKFNNFIIFLTFSLTFFLFGVFFSDSVRNLYVKNTNNGNINTNFIKEKILGKNDLDLKRFWEVYILLKQNYYSSEKVEKKDLVDGAISGLVNAIGDKHSEFLTRKDAKKFSEVLSGDFEGIGAVVEKIDFGVKIGRVLKGSPAKKSGLFSGDIILEANGNKLESLSLYSAVEKIKGPAGTKVLLKIVRTGEKDFLNIEVTREKINIPSIYFEVFKEENIGYIAINLFGENTSSDFEKALLQLNDTQGLIIDLRDNGGGYLQSAVQILSDFIEKGKVIVSTKYKNSFKNFDYKSKNTSKVYDKKIVVLINENSASASEILAGALSDYNKAILVGRKTYGKGSVQEPFYMNDGSLLKITIARWFTPNGKNIDKEGIEPDIEISFKKQDYDLDECKKVGICDDDDTLFNFNPYDRQLEEAKKILIDFNNIGILNLVVDKYNKLVSN